MGNRGAYGFRINDEDKVTYNHWDSYPKWLGRNVMDYIAQSPLADMRRAANDIVLVDSASVPGPELIKKYRKYADLSVSRQRYDDWYCLLRQRQGELLPYNNDLRHMVDFQSFLSDSLLCQWAYIVNLDNEKLEVYRGLNRDPSARGRYAARSLPDNFGYQGVALRKEIPVEHVRKEILEDLVKELDELGPNSNY